jgi:hypothetical protein
MKLEVLKRSIFRHTLSIVMVPKVLQWERQKRFSHYKCQGTMAKKCHFKLFFNIFFLFEKMMLPNVFILTRKGRRREGQK